MLRHQSSLSRRSRLWRAAALGLWLGAAHAWAAEIKIAFSTLERLIAEQAFTDDGRRYVKGGRSAKCSFAYLEKPRMSGRDGRLVIQARFTGRSALNMLGQCVGLGDAFDLTVYSVPSYANNQVALKDIVIETPRNSYYIGRVRDELRKSLAKPFDYNISNDVKKLLEQAPPNPRFQMKLDRFQVTSLRADNDGVVLSVDFAMLVK